MNNIEKQYRLSTTTINTFELLYGAYKFKMKEKNVLRLKRFLSQLEILYFDLESSEVAGKLVAELSNRGLSLEIRDIFIASKSQQEAYLKRDALTKENWYFKNKHFANIIKFLNTPYFRYMTTFLDHPEILKSGNSENVIRTWRQMEKVRYGFKTERGRQNHLKLYQIYRYLGGKLD